MKNLKEFIPLVKLVNEDKKKLVIASILVFASGIAEIFTGYLNGRAVEEITNLHIKEALLFLGIYYLIEIILDGVLVHKGESMLYTIESKVSRKLCFNAYKKALNMPAVAYEEHSSGEIINRITQDADTLSFAFGRLLNMVTSLIASTLVLIYIFINSWVIGLEIVLFLTIIFFVIKHYSPLMKGLHKERKTIQDNFAALTTESIRGIREIKTLGIRNNLIKDVTNIIKDILDKSIEEIDVEKRFNNITRLLKASLEVGVFSTCVILLYYGKTSLTFFVSMTYYVYRFTWLIENLNDISKTYQKTSVAIGRVNDITENRLYDDDKYGDKILKNGKGIIEFKNVTFAYPNEGVMLDDFNVKFKPNKKIAVIGKSGQGKSTIFNLLTRIFDTNEGEILIDGINIQDLDEESLKNNISIIRQEPFVFNRTILENFKLVDEDITLEEVRKYTKMAYLDDYIMELPKGYDTILGEGGVNLSGGQKQRLAIARTLSKKSKIILFDEATSALDNESQEYVKKSIDNLIKDHTVIIVAHRLSTILDADIIYVIDKGKVVAEGTHKTLLENNKIYQTLYKNDTLNS